MASCETAHKVFNPLVDKGIRIGLLPDWTNVRGRVAYRVLLGSYDQLPNAWSRFAREALEAARSAPRGPPGDVYLCGPMEHPKDPSKMLTVLYVPVQ